MRFALPWPPSTLENRASRRFDSRNSLGPGRAIRGSKRFLVVRSHRFSSKKSPTRWIVSHERTPRDLSRGRGDLRRCSRVRRRSALSRESYEGIGVGSASNGRLTRRPATPCSRTTPTGTEFRAARRDPEHGRYTVARGRAKQCLLSRVSVLRAANPGDRARTPRRWDGVGILSARQTCPRHRPRSRCRSRRVSRDFSRESPESAPCRPDG